ncbi:hypothetical protein JVT61DRAFT_8000 [Boletus reticuloceps]|uniref:Uncharacterized protein n=1 Tax=Boletus reticuloceps TaxID=495285 RepID=A0A8I2YI55_9AGAM|nr:hypothetical protein JVT61DRAFT_8000 [Boletus reticuloceps]
MPADRLHYLADLSSTVHRARRVPLPAAGALLHRPHFAIWFKNLRESSDSRGVHLADLFRPNSEPETLDGAADIVLRGLGGDRSELKFITNWPGYEPEPSTISTVSVNGGPLTRRELGKEIMYAYGRFFSKVVKEKTVPSQIGFYNIAPYQGQESTPCSLGVQLSQLHLVKLREPVPGDDHWFAEIDIVRM